MDDDKVGSYYLGGFSKLSGPMRYFCVVAAISSRPTEALSLALLEDDRAVRNVEAYEACLHEEMDWMQNLTLPVWELLELVAYSVPLGIRGYLISGIRGFPILGLRGHPILGT